MAYDMGSRKIVHFVFFCWLNSYCLGAFLGLALFHLLPEALHSPHESLSRYNVIYVVICSGFLFIFMVEKVVAPGMCVCFGH